MSEEAHYVLLNDEITPTETRSQFVSEENVSVIINVLFSASTSTLFIYIFIFIYLRSTFHT